MNTVECVICCYFKMKIGFFMTVRITEILTRKLPTETANSFHSDFHADKIADSDRI